MNRFAVNRQVVPWVLMALALTVLTALLFGRFVDKRREGMSQVQVQLEREVSDRVVAWEESLLERLDGWILDAVDNIELASATELRLRKHEPWFDSIYLWTPSRDVVVAGRHTERRGEFLYPTSPPIEPLDRLSNSPCMVGARLLTMNPLARADDIAAAYLTGCRREPLPVRMVAATEATVHLQRARMYREALQTLDASGVDPDIPLRKVAEQDLNPFRVVVHRIQRADILLALGKTDEALDLLYETGLAITSLPAPVMDRGRLRPYVQWPIITKLQEHKREAQVLRLQRAVRRAERRVLGWKEIDDRILLRAPTATSSTGTRFIYDQYHDTPFLLYYDPAHASGLGIGLQIDQPLLLHDFLDAMRSYRSHLVITDTSGKIVIGPRRGGPIVVNVPFSQSLTHLRVGLREDFLAERVERFSDQLVLLLILGAAAVVLTFMLLSALYRANAGLNQLLRRQREFTTRVTHELKTPLAGIRVMAENLQAGAYRDEEHMRNMAERIVDEADRLTDRVDEVLAVTQERKVPEAVPFDPEEPVLEAIDTWGPRLEQAGLKLHADLHPTDEVRGYAAAVRDAVGCLLDNALKYRDDDRKDPQVWLTLSQTGRWIDIVVDDNGIGIPAEKRQVIFERFVRVEGPNRGRGGGHGLGLAQVAEVARQHKGRVECLQGVEGGTRFVLRLRAA